MISKKKIAHELKEILLVSLYFFAWFGTLMLIKVLLLEEYNIKFYGFSVVVLGALVAAKAVLILEHLPLKIKNTPEIVNILLRTLLYLTGITIILILEHAIEDRHEYGGIINALKSLPKKTDLFHILVNIIGTFWALFFYNLWSVVNTNCVETNLWIILFSSTKNQKKYL